MADNNLAFLFGAILAGGVVIEYGTRNLKSASANQTPAHQGGSGNTTGETGANAVGSVTRTDLLTLASPEGWGASEVDAWEGVITKESNGNPRAVNPSSGAAGIAQGITGWSWYAAHGGSAGSVMGQLTAMKNYIKQRYGTPSAALAHENAYGWY